MQKTSLTEEEARKIQYKFDFKNFYSQTLFLLIEWLNNPKSLTQLSDFTTLFELYRLADYLNDPIFTSDCLAQFKNHLNKENRLEILTKANYDVADPLIQDCCSFVTENFQKMGNHKMVLEIPHEYFIEIAKNIKMALKKQEAKNFCNFLYGWAKSQAKKEKATPRKILYLTVAKHTLIECFPFESMSAQEFESYILYRQILSLKDTNFWLKFFLKSYTYPPPQNSEFLVNKINEFQAEITWNISLENVYASGSVDDNPIISSKFNLGGFKWDLFIAKEENASKMFIGTSVQNTNILFNCLIQVNQLCYYSDPPQQAKSQEWINKTFSIKGVVYSLQEIEANFDLKKCCLPVKATIFLLKNNELEPAAQKNSSEESASEADSSEGHSSEE